MPDPFSRIHKILLVFLFALNLGGCTAIYDSGFVPIPDQEISGPVEIGPEWIEITPPKPLVAYGWSQAVVVDIEGLDVSKGFDLPGQSVYLKSGESVIVEAFIFDDSETAHKMKVSGIGKGVLLGIATDNSNNGEKINQGSPEDHNRTYTKVKIRTTKKVKCINIIWQGSVPK